MTAAPSDLEPAPAGWVVRRAAEPDGGAVRIWGLAPGVRHAGPPELAPAYVAKLRKREPAYVFAARAEIAAEVERRTFDASYKGLTDLVTKWVWPRPAQAAVRWCARRGVHPNTVTLW